MSKIIGSITATPNPLSDWNQTDAKKADYIKNKPNLDTYEFITVDDIDEICSSTTTETILDKLILGTTTV